jgi:hypothetical protein
MSDLIGSVTDTADYAGSTRLPKLGLREATRESATASTPKSRTRALPGQ